MASGGWPRSSALVVRAAGLLALLPVAWAVTIGAFHDRGFVVDDAFISYRFARNLADGFGLAWNPGGDRCEGYTNFLYVALVASGVRLGGAAPAIGLAIGIAAALATVALVGRLCRPVRWWSVASAALAIAWWWRQEPRIHAGRGLETALFGALVAVLLAQARPAARLAANGARRWAALAATSIALVLCRPDGLLVVAVVWGALALAVRESHGGWPVAWRAATVALVVALGGYVAWKRSYFGYLLPNSYYAKARAPGWPGAADTWRFVADHALPLALCGAAMVLQVAVAVVAPLLRGRAWSEVARRELRPALALTLSGLWLAYGCKIVHEMGYHHRFSQPVVVLALVGGCYAIRDLGRALRRVRPLPFALPLATAAFAVVAAVQWRAMVDEGTRVFQPAEADSVVVMFERLGRGIGVAAQGGPLLLACTHAGATPYFADVDHVDPGGLVDDGFNARRTPRERREYRDSLRPDVICWHLFPASEGARSLDDDRRAMESAYFRWFLVGDASIDALARYDVEHRAADRRREAFEMMVHLRDECTLVGEMRSGARRWREFVYVSKGSARHDELVERLRGLVDVPVERVGYDGWPDG